MSETKEQQSSFEEAEKLCNVFMDEFDQPRNDEIQLHIARHTIKALIKRIEGLELQLSTVSKMARQGYRRTMRYK